MHQSQKRTYAQRIRSNVPDELLARQQWVIWRHESPAPGEARTKMPYRLDGRKACTKSAMRTWWHTSEVVLDAIEHGDVIAAGVGFVFADDDPYVGVDLDDCRDPETGQLETWAETIVANLNTYTEVSPSGTGVKSICRGSMPEWSVGERCRRKFTKLDILGSDHGAVEICRFSQYFAMTGEPLPSAPAEVRDAQDAIEDLLALLDPEDASDSFLAPPGEPAPGSALTDNHLLAIAFAAKNGDKLRRLWELDWANQEAGAAESGYPSASEVDLALCAILAFYCGPDPARIRRLFDRSMPGERSKWRRRKDYRAMTIQRAIEGQNGRFWKPSGAPSVHGEPCEQLVALVLAQGGELLHSEKGSISFVLSDLIPLLAGTEFEGQSQTKLQSTLSRHWAYQGQEQRSVGGRSARRQQLTISLLGAAD